jgi:hypothetical protein
MPSFKLQALNYELYVLLAWQHAAAAGSATGSPSSGRHKPSQHHQASNIIHRHASS